MHSRAGVVANCRHVVRSVLGLSRLGGPRPKFMFKNLSVNIKKKEKERNDKFVREIKERI